MVARLARLALTLALLASACSGDDGGPTEPVPASEVDVDDAVRAAGARDAARRFVDAYARSPVDEGASLRPMAGTPLLRRWAEWLEIQNREFPGAVTGITEAILIGPAVPFEVENVPGSNEILREVDVRASVTFSFAPVDDDAFTVTRSLDGPMRLIRAPEGDWSVLDFTRDGLPLSRQFEPVERAGAKGRSVEIAVVAFFAAPIWQFGLVVRSLEATRLSAAQVTLVDDGGTPVATAGAITGSLSRLEPDATVRGLVTFDPLSSADGLSLRIELGSGKALEIALTDRIHPIPMAEVTPTPDG